MKQNKKQNSNAQQAAEMLKQALKRPGISELMEVYESWQTLEAASKPHRRAMGIKRVISASNSSGPALRRIS